MDNRSIEILHRFEKSWKQTEKIFDLFLKNDGFQRLKPVRGFLSQLKKQGADKHFRIGTSLYRLIISRSVEHGLRDDQKRITIDTVAANDYVITFSEGSQKYREYRVSDLNDPRLTALLATLEETLID